MVDMRCALVLIRWTEKRGGGGGGSRSFATAIATTAALHDCMVGCFSLRYLLLM